MNDHPLAGRVEPVARFKLKPLCSFEALVHDAVIRYPWLRPEPVAAGPRARQSAGRPRGGQGRRSGRLKTRFDRRWRRRFPAAGWLGGCGGGRCREMNTFIRHTGLDASSSRSRWRG